mmetsp:Transcript_3755/g.9376  ORF Transcript_3755/g.9376 Transcript_3755/m.9376 type:complete len:277 (+) Transcript_3755:1164-1994(+)
MPRLGHFRKRCARCQLLHEVEPAIDVAVLLKVVEVLWDPGVAKRTQRGRLALKQLQLLPVAHALQGQRLDRHRHPVLCSGLVGHGIAAGADNTLHTVLLGSQQVTRLVARPAKAAFAGSFLLRRGSLCRHWRCAGCELHLLRCLFLLQGRDLILAFASTSSLTTSRARPTSLRRADEARARNVCISRQSSLSKLGRGAGTEAWRDRGVAGRPHDRRGLPDRRGHYIVIACSVPTAANGDMFFLSPELKRKGTAAGSCCVKYGELVSSSSMVVDGCE